MTRMRAFFILLFLTVFSCASRAQVVGEVLTINEKTFGFHGTLTGQVRTFKSDQEAQDVVTGILSSMGLPLRFEVFAASVPNAAAVYDNGKRKILYNVVFMESIKQKTGDYWSLISIMAHEIGHHLSFHLNEAIEDHKAELEADCFSGFVLRKSGATLKQALAAMEAIASPMPSKSHPGRDDRLQAIALGWKAGTGRAPDPGEVSKIPPGDPDLSVKQPPVMRSERSSACGWYSIHYCSRVKEVAESQSEKFGGTTIDTSDPAYPNFADGWYCSVLGPIEKTRADAVSATARQRGFPTAYVKNPC